MLSPLQPEDFQLTMEQEFMLVRYNQLVNEVSQDELRETLLEITRQLMIKDNVIRTLVKSGI
jgi:Phycobilisome degradation protein nblA